MLLQRLAERALSIRYETLPAAALLTAREAILDTVGATLAVRIEVGPHPDAVMDTTDHFFAEVRVETRGGSVFETYVDRPVGRDRDHPLPSGALEAKFRDCAGRVLDPAEVEALETALLGLDEVPSLHELSPLLVSKDRRSPAAGEWRHLTSTQV